MYSKRQGKIVVLLNTGKSYPTKKVTNESQEMHGGMIVVENLYSHHDTSVCAINPSALVSTQDNESTDSIQLVFIDNTPELERGAGIEKGDLEANYDTSDVETRITFNRY